MSATANNEVRPSLHHLTIKTSRLDEMITWCAVVADFFCIIGKARHG